MIARLIAFLLIGLRAALLACAIFSSPIVYAVEPDEILADKPQETRARALSSELRCLVCQNQSIDDSDAALAKDLRKLVRQRIEAGDSDEAVKAYLVSRYGEFVLLKPPVTGHTWLLWALPFLALGMGAMLVMRFAIKPRPEDAAKLLDPDEQAKLERLLKEGSA